MPSFQENIATHVEMLLDDEMRAHAYADKTHDLDFQVFRVLGGYRLALDEVKAARGEIERLREALTGMLALHRFEHAEVDAVSSQALAALAPSAPDGEVHGKHRDDQDHSHAKEIYMPRLARSVTVPGGSTYQTYWEPGLPSNVGVYEKVEVFIEEFPDHIATMAYCYARNDHLVRTLVNCPLDIEWL